MVVKSEPRYHQVTALREHDVPAKLDRLAALLTVKRGAKVSKAEALNIAIEEAIARRE